MKFLGTFSEDGLRFGSNYNISRLKDYGKKNPGTRFELSPITPESRQQRGYFEGGIVPLVTHFQEGMHHENPDDLRRVRDYLKIEFCGEWVEIKGKSNRVAGSTKGKLNQGFLERVLEWLEENYQPPREALDPEFYKKWKNEVWPFGGPPTFIDYLISLNLIK